jgi:CRP-like cAMP-binding protein
MNQEIIAYFEQYLPLSQSEKEAIQTKFRYQSIKRREFILEAGNICRYYTFIVSGCFRMFGMDKNGNEHNIQFAAENDWIMDIGSFHTQKRSELNLKAMESSVILQVQQEDLYFLYLNIPKLDRIFKVIIENKYVELQNHVLQNISSTAQQRYLSFLDQYPHLTNRIPNAQIASYLGITPEFLSKVRKDLATTKGKNLS